MSNILSSLRKSDFLKRKPSKGQKYLSNVSIWLLSLFTIGSWPLHTACNLREKIFKAKKIFILYIISQTNKYCFVTWAQRFKKIKEDIEQIVDHKGIQMNLNLQDCTEIYSRTRCKKMIPALTKKDCTCSDNLSFSSVSFTFSASTCEIQHSDNNKTTATKQQQRNKDNKRTTTTPKQQQQNNNSNKTLTATKH